MLSASFNQTQNQGLRFNLSDNSMSDFTSNVGYTDNYIPKPEMYNQSPMSNLNQDSKMYSISEVDSLIHSNHMTFANDFNLNHIDHKSSKEFDFNMLSSRLQMMGIKSNCNLSRSNSAHNSPFDNRVTSRHFPHSTSNTPLPLASRLNREIDMMRGNPPIMQLFSNNNSSNNMNSNHSVNQQLNNNSYSLSRQSPIELIEYQSMASKMGFLVGQDLDEVLNRSATMKNSNSSRISNFFKHKHGSSTSYLTQKQYLVLGVRVPSKEHVSEIVGKEGKKIKMIRQTTGALIATPNEKEDHVFLIEAIPDTAIKVGQIIQQLSEQITRNKLGNITGLIGERPRTPPMLGNRTPLAVATIGVPQRLVGKVIGTQGSIITTVQKETGTEIKSPPKDELRAPGDTADFEISVYENGTVNSEETAWLQIHRAKQLIAHLVMRVWDQQPRNSTPSSDEGNCPSSTCVPEWIWPEVSRMDDGDAKEIIDRILRSSKAKITSSTSSTEGANVDGLVMPVSSSGMSSSFPLSLLQDNKSSSGFHSVHTTPFKLMSSEDNGSSWNQRNATDCYSSSLDNQCRQVNGFKNTPNFYQSHYSNFQSSLSDSQVATGRQSDSHQYYPINDCAFYDSYYPNMYPPPTRDGSHLFMCDNYGLEYPDSQNNCHNVTPIPTTFGNNNDSSWPKQAFYSSINSNNQNYDDPRYGNVKYLWKNSNETSNSSVPQSMNVETMFTPSWSEKNDNEQQSIHLRQNSRSIPIESVFGTIGDGRKRNSAASSSGEDL